MMKKMRHIKEFNEFSPDLSEEVRQGAKGDPYEYKEEGGKYYTRKKGAPNWILTKGNIEKEIKNKIFPTGASVPQKPKEPLNFEPYKLTQNSYDSQRYQRDTFDPYAQQNLKQKNLGELKSQQLVRGIVPMKKESGIKPHYRIFGDFLKARKNPITSSDFTKDELNAMKNLILQSKSKLGPSPTNIDFPAVAGVKYGKLKTGEEKQTDLEMPKSVSYVLGNAQVSDKGNYYLINDIYDFNNYQNHPENYTLANSPATIKTAIEKVFSGNLVQGVEELASYYQKLGYKGIPVSIQVPKNIA
jgi:hypothetical protein